MDSSDSFTAESGGGTHIFGAINISAAVGIELSGSLGDDSGSFSFEFRSR